jgi:hypothetical protein
MASLTNVFFSVWNLYCMICVCHFEGVFDIRDRYRLCIPNKWELIPQINACYVCKVVCSSNHFIALVSGGNIFTWVTFFLLILLFLFFQFLVCSFFYNSLIVCLFDAFIIIIIFFFVCREKETEGNLGTVRKSIICRLVLLKH